MDYSITLPSGGETLPGTSPVVVVGPNGSGKTRQTRKISAAVSIQFVNALRNTRVAPDLPAMGVETARNNYNSHVSQARSTHWELSNEFDYMLSQLLAQKSMAAIEFQDRYEADPASAGQPTITPLSRVEKLWRDVFDGRKLSWRDWKPLVQNATSGTGTVEYSSNQMSDGEKAVLFLASRVFSTEPGILVVDEPETHLHTLLAVRLWNALEDARPDIRFVYVTHDMAFALSRRDARFILASPTAGLRTIELDEDLPNDVAGALIGSASLSFYASRVVFCEGDEGSYDNQLYSAWFRGADTVVKSVGECQRVLRCVDALSASGVAMSLDAIGIIDGDYHPDAFTNSLPIGVSALQVHEVESLFALEGIVSAVCAHVSQVFDPVAYRSAIVASVNDEQASQITINRWKARIEPNLSGIVAGANKSSPSVDDLVDSIPKLFDSTNWQFSPQTFLIEERDRVRNALQTGGIAELLAVVPGKQLLAVAARTANLSVSAYVKLIVDALRGSNAQLAALEAPVAAALTPTLPQRFVEASIPQPQL